MQNKYEQLREKCYSLIYSTEFSATLRTAMSLHLSLQELFLAISKSKSKSEYLISDEGQFFKFVGSVSGCDNDDLFHIEDTPTFTVDLSLPISEQKPEVLEALLKLIK